jgi:alkanesulfonate monooxygenase SsuD/methylene tetrahydromethanopterin reductase-like flavin-dependent oxidoreductase (luciferase family)
LGWNEVEYVALNQDFHTRGRRIEEQVELMRALWTQPLVNFKGRWHEIPDAGIKPLPVQRPIPIWFGGQADPVLRRVARLGDGWMPNTRTPQDARPLVEKLNRYLEEEGRNPGDLGIEARIPYGEEDPDRWNTLIQEWGDLGADYFSINTMRFGFDTPGAHLDALKKFAAGVGLSA